MDSPDVLGPLLRFALATADQDRVVFIHCISSCGAVWHYSDCFPSVEECAIPIGGDLDRQAN
jgi:hypothetical protein